MIVEEAGSVGADTVSGPHPDVGGSGGGVVAWVISGKGSFGVGCSDRSVGGGMCEGSAGAAMLLMWGIR